MSHPASAPSVQDAPSTSSPQLRESDARISRRTIVRGAAWSVPVIAAAVAVPLASASGACPTLDRWWGESVEAHYFALNGTKWVTGTSTGTVGVGFGFNSGTPAYPALGFSSSEHVDITATALSYTFILQVPVSWTSISSGWQLTGSTSGAGTWTYTFTCTNLPVSATVTATGAPGTTVVPFGSASGTIISSQMPNGKDMSTITTFTVTQNVTYTPLFTTSAGCTSASGSDGVPRVRTQTVSGVPLSWSAN